MSNHSGTVKYTAILPQDSVNELRGMAAQKIIPSINQGIRIAVEDFIKSNKQREYLIGIREAASDKAFIQRTMDTQKAYMFVDAEADEQW